MANTENVKPTSTKVITGKVRGSYVNVFTPRRNDLSGKDEYSMTILIPKSDKATLRDLQRATTVALERKWGAKIPATHKTTLRDGDDERPDSPECVGHMFMAVKSESMPGIVDKDRQPIIDPMEFVSGDYCRVSLNAFAYDQKGNKGVSFGLNNIQVLSKGEPLGRARAEDDFDSFQDDEDFG